MTRTALLGLSLLVCTTACGGTDSGDSPAIPPGSPSVPENQAPDGDSTVPSQTVPSPGGGSNPLPGESSSPTGPGAGPGNTVPNGGGAPDGPSFGGAGPSAGGAGAGTPTETPATSNAGAPGPGATGGAGGPAPGAGGVGTGGSPDPGAGSPVERHGQLGIDGNRLVDASGAPVILRGQGFGWDNYWPQYYTADVVNWLRDDWCVDMVRPAMGIEPDGAYLQNPSASQGRVQAVVDAAIAKGIYVIIDWHAHDLHQTEAIEFFSAMAQAYGDSENVIYEVFNEPEDDETWPQVKAYAEAVIAAIRQHDPDNLVIVGSPEWDQRIDLVAADPITSDENVIYSVHFYAGTHGAWLRDRVLAAMQSGIPVLVSESSGSEAAGTGANNYTEWQAWFDFMDANEISWLNYSVSDKAGETISVLEPGAPTTGGWDDTQLTESGEYMRALLREYCRY